MNIDFFLGALIGGFASTYVMNLLFLYVVLRKWRQSISGVYAAIILTLATRSILGGYGYQDDGLSPLFMEAFLNSLLPAALVLSLELTLLARMRQTSRERSS